MATSDGINNLILIIEGYLSDIEFDASWSEAELYSFSAEWIEVVSCVKIVYYNQASLSTEQENKLYELRQRFKAVDGKLKQLNLENPFELQFANLPSHNA